jgi:hypothetical protein
VGSVSAEPSNLGLLTEPGRLCFQNGGSGALPSGSPSHLTKSMDCQHSTIEHTHGIMACVAQPACPNRGTPLAA